MPQPHPEPVRASGTLSSKAPSSKAPSSKALCALVVVASALCAAACRSDAVPVEPPTLPARVGLLNATGVPQALTVRNLRADVELDCDTVARDPAAYIGPRALGPARAARLAPGEQLALVGSDGVVARTERAAGRAARACDAAVVAFDLAGPDVLVFWRHDLPLRAIARRAAGGAPTEPGTLVLREAAGGRLGWQNVHGAPRHQPWRPAQASSGQASSASPEQRAACAADEPALTWHVPHARLEALAGRWSVVSAEAVDASPNCVTYMLEPPEAEGAWQPLRLCAPLEVQTLLEPVLGARVALTIAHRSTPQLEALEIEVHRSRGEAVLDHRRVVLFRGYAFPAGFGFEATEDGQAAQLGPLDGCAPTFDGCGNTSLAAALHVTSDAGDTVVMGAGQAVQDGPRQWRLSKLLLRPVRALQCPGHGQFGPQDAGSAYVEGTLVIDLVVDRREGDAR